MTPSEAFYRMYPHKLLAKKHAEAMLELRELGDAVAKLQRGRAATNGKHVLERTRWAAEMQSLRDELTRVTDREPA